MSNLSVRDLFGRRKSSASGTSQKGQQQQRSQQTALGVGLTTRRSNGSMRSFNTDSGYGGSGSPSRGAGAAQSYYGATPNQSGYPQQQQYYPAQPVYASPQAGTKPPSRPALRGLANKMAQQNVGKRPSQESLTSLGAPPPYSQYGGPAAANSNNPWQGPGQQGQQAYVGQQQYPNQNNWNQPSQGAPGQQSWGQPPQQQNAWQAPASTNPWGQSGYQQNWGAPANNNQYGYGSQTSYNNGQYNNANSYGQPNGGYSQNTSNGYGANPPHGSAPTYDQKPPLQRPPSFSKPALGRPPSFSKQQQQYDPYNMNSMFQALPGNNNASYDLEYQQAQQMGQKLPSRKSSYNNMSQYGQNAYGAQKLPSRKNSYSNMNQYGGVNQYGAQQQVAPYGQQQGGYGNGAAGGPFSQGAILEMLQFCVGEQGISYFWPQDEVNKVAYEVSTVGSCAQIKSAWGLEDKEALKMCKLALFDIVLYLDDSYSMRDGHRIRDLAKIAAKVTEASLMFDDDGISIRFINSSKPDPAHPRGADNVKTAQDASDIVQATEYNHGTPIGTGMDKEILNRYVRKPIRENRFKKPLLIISITDGEPTGEDRKMMNRVITKIHNELQGTKYTPDAVSFMFSQVGDDEEAEKWLQELDEDPIVKDLIDAVSGYEMECKQYHQRGHKAPSMAKWLVKLMLGAIDKSYDRKDELHKEVISGMKRRKSACKSISNLTEHKSLESLGALRSLNGLQGTSD